MLSSSCSKVQKRLFTATLLSALGLGLVAGVCPTAASAEPANNRLVTYQDQGKTLFALSLMPTQTFVAKNSPRVAVIVDTSASQNGDFRTDSIDVAQSIIEALPEKSLVSLIACDVEAVVLSAASVPSSNLLTEAFKKLEKRVPLGTTDLAAAIRVAVRELGKEPDASIVYIGDGMHLCNLLNTLEFESLINELRDSRTSISALAIGPRTDCELLSTISNHTGGKVFVRQAITNATCQQIGDALAKVALEPVFWPTKSSWPNGVAQYFPGRFPPLRLDRDSILVGNLQSESLEGNLQIEGVVDGQTSSMRWELKSEPSNPDFAFLAQVVSKAAPNSGLLLPTPGSEALQELGIVLASSSDQLVKDARFALNSGDISAAINIAKEAINRSPNNLAAQNILTAAEQTPKPEAKKPVKPVKSPSASPKIVKFISAQVPEDPFADPPTTSRSPTFGDGRVPTVPSLSNPFGDTPNSIAPSVLEGNDPFNELADASDLLAQDEGLRRVKAQQMESMVRNELSQARRSRDPSATKISLKSLLDQIRRSPELDASERTRLDAQVASAIQASARAEVNLREQLSRTEAVQASQSASKRLLAESERRNATVQQLVERYNSLMAQQLFAAANNEIAPQITAIDRDSIVDRVTNIESNMASNHQLIMNAVNKRSRAFVDSLYLNELALVPFVDDPPIIYPPADVWQALSARRLERYGSIDLSGGKESERKIYRALNERGEVNFNATPLGAVMKILKGQYDIPIVIDEKALEEESITLDEPITLELPAVTFRSALKLILEPLQLTYVIEDEVMRITSKKSSANVVRVYPVGDLVVPIIRMGGGGMGGMGGGMGGMGGGMGGMGGGMGGMGGGMGGMGGGMGGMGGGMGGMGGGMMRVEDDPSKSSDKTPSKLDRTPSQLVDELVASDAGERLISEAALSSWVVNKMVLAKKAAAANKDKEVRMHFQEVIDTIGDAMRRTLPAAWMYQALSTAMEGCEYPGSEIRRVLLSSIDFGGDVDASIKIGKYLAGQGMKREALSVFHDAHRSNPMLKEPLELGLELSTELGDQEGIRWTCTGILSQAWTDDHLPLIQKAQLAAKASYIRLNDAKETVKANAFEKEMKQARLRDLVVRVVWTGDADIDIAVEEPTGTICDKNNTRTLSGGLMLADGSSLDKASKDGYSETYVCANGYAGSYRILIRKVWGEVSGGKVTVNVLSDYGTADQKIDQHQVPIQQDAIVQVEVKSGHRKEPIVDAQLAKVQTRMAEAGAVLAQANPGQSQGNGPGYSPAYRQLLAQYAGGQNGIGGNGQFGGPFLRRGVVGYRPIIQTIPQGTNLTALSVISGDRRYVRITPSPNFTDIIEVFTFNTFTGGTGGGGGQGGGGQGGGAQGGGGGGGFGGGGAF